MRNLLHEDLVCPIVYFIAPALENRN